jgi:hypothetical protein
MFAHAVQQRPLDRGLIGVGIWSARKTDRAEAPAPCRSDRSGRGIEIAVVASFNPVGEEL